MSTTPVTIFEGDSDLASRDRVFDCPYCGEKFIGHSTDSGFTLATFAEMSELGITAKCTCPTCSGVAVSVRGSAGEIPTLQKLVILSLPAKAIYRPGEKFDTTGLVIGAVYSNGAVTPVSLSDCTLSPATSANLTLDNQKVVVTHTESSKTIDVPILVRNQQIIKPTLINGTFTYTGSAIAVEVKGFDSDTMTRSNYSKTNAGSYTATYTPKTGYCWEDGTTSAVSIAWVINKAQMSKPVLSATSLTLTAIATPGTFTVTREGTGSITVNSSNGAVCTAAKDGTTVTVTAVANGTATVTVTAYGDANWLAPAEKATCAVTVALA